MSTAQSRSRGTVKVKPWTYDNFQGLDSTRDATALDTGTGQHLIDLNNGYCDWRGQIVRDRPATRVNGRRLTVHIAFYDTEKYVWAEQDAQGVHLLSSEGHELDEAYVVDSLISTTIFSRKVHFASRGGLMRYFDGSNFGINASPSMALLRPSYLTTVNRRMCAAGIPGFETEVHISRVDDPNVFPNDEAAGDENALRAGIIDIANLTRTADSITGISEFEQDRLVMFTQDRAIVYVIDPDISQWALDRSVNIKVGCVSHNTIQNAGTDLLFCSRTGVHSIRRSTQNGIVISSLTLSDKVDLLYRQLFATVQDPTQISAVYDQDRAQYHVHFPQRGGVYSKRLSLTLNPQVEDGGNPTFSTSDFLNIRHGDALGGMFLCATSGGVYQMLDEEALTDDEILAPDLSVMTPFLWHGDFHAPKTLHSLTIQASGNGVIEIDCIDVDGSILKSARVVIEEPLDDGERSGVALSRQYELPWQVTYVGAKYQIRVKESTGLVRITGLAIKVRT